MFYIDLKLWDVPIRNQHCHFGTLGLNFPSEKTKWPPNISRSMIFQQMCNTSFSCDFNLGKLYYFYDSRSSARSKNPFQGHLFDVKNKFMVLDPRSSRSKGHFQGRKWWNKIERNVRCLFWCDFLLNNLFLKLFWWKKVIKVQFRGQVKENIWFLTKQLEHCQKLFFRTILSEKCHFSITI